MSSPEQPKVILFDIGGVCTVLDYELSSNIPPGWINYAISKSSPNGTWHRLERGEIPLDASFYSSFNNDLHDPSHWATFYRREAAGNLKPTSTSTSISLDPSTIPPVPRIDGQWLFNAMMANSRFPDPWMAPALDALKKSGKYIIAALSNTFIFPEGHPLHVADFFAEPTRRLFDVFVSSAHEGMRKPEPRVYELTLERLNEYARGKGLGLGLVRAGDVLFLDDIGENLREARRLGFRTVKVNLGRGFEAVDELEKVTGLELHGAHPRVPIQPSYSKMKAKI